MGRPQRVRQQVNMPPVDPSDQSPLSTIKGRIGSALRAWFKGGSPDNSSVDSPFLSPETKASDPLHFSFLQSRTSQPSTTPTPGTSTQSPHKTTLSKGPSQTSAPEFKQSSPLSQKGIATRDAVGVSSRDARTLERSMSCLIHGHTPMVLRSPGGARLVRSPTERGERGVLVPRHFLWIPDFLLFT